MKRYRMSVTASCYFTIEAQALLGDPFTTPVLPQWVPHLQSALEEDGLLTALSGEGCTSAYLTASSEDLDRLVSDGIRNGALKINARSRV